MVKALDDGMELAVAELRRPQHQIGPLLLIAKTGDQVGVLRSGNDPVAQEWVMSPGAHRFREFPDQVDRHVIG